MRRFPHRPDLLFLPLGCENVLLHTQLKKVLQMGGLGIVTACLPLADRATGDAQQSGQTSLRQANAAAQLEHKLPIGVLLAFLVTRRHPTRNANQQGTNMAPAGN